MNFARRLAITAAVVAAIAALWVSGVALAPGPIPWSVAAVGVVAPGGAGAVLLLHLRADHIRLASPRGRRARAGAGLEASR
jgi:hypothetical protein